MARSPGWSSQFLEPIRPMRSGLFGKVKRKSLMPRKSDQPLVTVTLNLVEGDREVLERFFPKPIGYQLIVRTLVHDFVKGLLEQESRQEEGPYVHEPLSAERLAALGIAGSDDEVDGLAAG